MPSVMPAVRRTVLLGTLLVAVTPRLAAACLCISGGCDSVLASKTIFEATVVAVERPATYGGNVVVRLADGRPVVGEAAPSVLIGGDGASCAYQFTVGERYLIDAYESQPGRFGASNCGHTKPLVAAGGLLAYLSLPSPIERGRVWGRVSTGGMADRRVGRAGGPPVDGAEVTLSGTVQRRRRANANGEFSFVGVPDGAYKASPLPSGQARGSHFRLWSPDLRPSSRCLAVCLRTPARR